MERLNESLINRGFLTWFDITNMKGSTMDASEFISNLSHLPFAYFPDKAAVDHSERCDRGRGRHALRCVLQRSFSTPLDLF